MRTIKPSFTTKQINDVLKKGGDITFTSGQYDLTECLVLYSNTRVICERATTFRRQHKGRMLQTHAGANTTGYSGVHDVTWEGGSFVADTRPENANVISLFHAYQITLRGVQIYGCRGLHSIEINACKDVLIDNCYISSQTSKDGETFREAIQIDFASRDGLKISGTKPTSPCYDGTHCTNITVQDTSIHRCPNGFGTHSVSVEEKYHKNIILQNVGFADISGYHIQLYGVDCFTASKIDYVWHPKIHIGVKTKGHKLSGGKVDLSEPRRNGAIRIESTLIDGLV